MGRKKAEDAPKPRRQVVRQRKGPIDPRKLEDEAAHAHRFLQMIRAEQSKLRELSLAGELRIRQIEALMNLPTLDIPNEGGE